MLSPPSPGSIRARSASSSCASSPVSPSRRRPAPSVSRTPSWSASGRWPAPGCDAPCARPDMTPERWQALKEIFHATLDCAPEQRELLLAARCAGDDELRAEIAALLAEHAQASTFLGRRAREQAAGALRIDALGLAPGRRILHYELIAPLGEGGMGIVYRA